MIISGSLEIVVVSDSVEEGSMIVVKADLNVALNFEGSSFAQIGKNFLLFLQNLSAVLSLYF